MGVVTLDRVWLELESRSPENALAYLCASVLCVMCICGYVALPYVC